MVNIDHYARKSHVASSCGRNVRRQASVRSFRQSEGERKSRRQFGGFILNRDRPALWNGDGFGGFRYGSQLVDGDDLKFVSTAGERDHR
jgi:hypothetical protein